MGIDQLKHFFYIVLDLYLYKYHPVPQLWLCFVIFTLLALVTLNFAFDEMDYLTKK